MAISNRTRRPPRGRPAILVSGSVNGNVIAEGRGRTHVANGSVAGNLEQKGTGFLIIEAFSGGVSTVNGNVIHEGTGFTALAVFFGGAVTVDGNVEAKVGGSNEAFTLDGSVLVDGDVCGGPPTGYASVGVTVNGSIDASC